MEKREIDILLRKVAEGDNNAFEKLYVETRRGVYSFLFSYFNNRFDCEDVMQIAYLKIKTHISQYKVGTNGLAWILQIAKNTALNEIRSRSNSQKLQLNDDRGSDYFETMTLRDSLMLMMKKVLDEEEQRIIILHVIWDYKHKEIAEILNCPVGTITSKYKRAVDKLKSSIKEDEL